MQQYLNLLTEIKSKGTKKEDRTGTGTISIFGHQMRFDLNDGFPLVTTKKVNFNAILHELLWFIRGETNIEYLVKFAVLNNKKINRDLCKDPLKWQSGLKKEESYKNNEKSKLFRSFSKSY